MNRHQQQQQAINELLNVHKTSRKSYEFSFRMKKPQASPPHANWKWSRLIKGSTQQTNSNSKKQD